MNLVPHGYNALYEGLSMILSGEMLHFMSIILYISSDRISTALMQSSLDSALLLMSFFIQLLTNVKIFTDYKENEK